MPSNRVNAGKTRLASNASNAATGIMTTISQIWQLLSRPERRKAAALFVLMICAMFFELLGVGMVVPALAFMVQDSSILESPAVRPWITWLGNPSQSHLVLVGLAALAAVYVLKSGFLLLVSYFQSRFVSDVQASMTSRLFERYLTQPWAFHLSRNSAELIRNIESIQGFAVTCTAVISLATELLVLVGLVALLLWFEPTGAAIAAIVLGACTYMYDCVTRSRLANWGWRRHAHLTNYLKHMQEGLGGAKDVKIIGCERQLIRRFTNEAVGLADMTGRQSWFHQIPRMWYELLAVMALCLLTAVMLWQGKPLRSFVPSLGLFATAAFRLLPSVNRLAVSLQQIRWAKTLTNCLHDELALPIIPPAEGREAALPFRTAIELDHVSFRYPGCDIPALADITLSIPHGASVGIVGGSGAGKSTLVDIILGLLPPTEGRVTVDSADVQGNVRAWQSLVGYVPQNIYLCDDTVRRNIAFGLDDQAIDEQAVSRTLRAAQLESFVANLPMGLDTTIGERGVRLSGGQRQRIGIARALYYDPAVLVLDEATSALDTDTERDVMTAVESLHGHKTIIIVAHRMSTVARCDVVFRIENGRLVRSGTLNDVL
jgi:ABC-type multidrug transport system fused ATPase/permease subunit